MAEPPASAALVRGAVAWATLEPVKGRGQGGHRPVVVVASAAYLEVVTTLVLVVPVTTVDRDWPNHVRLTGSMRLPKPSWAMTEQIRTIARDRISAASGRVADDCLQRIDIWLGDFLELSTDR